MRTDLCPRHLERVTKESGKLSNCSPNEKQRIDYILFNNWEISQLYPYKEYKEEYELLTDTIKEVFNSKFYTEYPYELITYKLHN